MIKGAHRHTIIAWRTFEVFEQIYDERFAWQYWF